MKKHLYAGSAWVLENPVRPFLLALVALLLVAWFFQRTALNAAMREAQSVTCPAPKVSASRVMSVAPAPALPVPSPQWASPKQQGRMMDAQDGCFKLAGLNHQIMKCWSHELWPGPHGVSKWLYYVDQHTVCETKRKAGLSCTS